MLRIATHKPGARSIAWGRSTIDGPLPFRGTFDAVGCFYDALNHLNDTAALARAIAAMAAALRPGGVLVFDVTNAEGFARWWRGKPQFAGDGWRLSIEMQFDAQRQLGLADVAIAIGGAPAGRFTLRERYFSRAAVLEALAAARLVRSRNSRGRPSTAIWQARPGGSPAWPGSSACFCPFWGKST